MHRILSLWVAGMLALVGCSASSGGLVSVMRHSQDLDPELADAKGVGWQLVAKSERDTVAASDSIRIVYAVVNHGRQAAFSNDPYSFDFEVWNENDKQLRPRVPFEPPLLGAPDDQIIPMDGFLGRTVNLECYTIGNENRLPATCSWMFELSEPGEYRVLVSYRKYRGLEQDPTMSLEADTVRVYRLP